MSRFKKRVEYVEAVQWRPGAQIPGVTKTGQGIAIVNTPVGNAEVHEGDWVVKTEQGVRFVLCPEEFEKEYEADLAPPDLAEAEPEPLGKAGTRRATSRASSARRPT